MFAVILKIQRKIADLSNENPYPGTAEVLEDLAQFVNKLSVWEIVDVDRKTIVRNKKTLKEV